MAELTDAVKEEEQAMEKRSPGLLKKIASGIFHGGLATAATFVGYTAVGFGAPLTGIGFAAGSLILNLLNKAPDKKSKGLFGILRDYTVGAIIGIAGVAIYDYATAIPKGIVRGLVGAIPGMALWTGLYVGADHLIKHGPKGIGEAYKKDFWPVFKYSTVGLGWLVYLTINGSLGGYPGIVVGDAAYRTVAGLAQKPDKQPQPANDNVPQPHIPHQQAA